MGIQFLCRGPVIGQYTEEDVENGLISSAAIGHKKRGILKKVSKAKGRVGIDDDGEIVVEASKSIDSCTPCNYDLTMLINALPEDGLEYDVECPSCSNVVSVRRGLAAKTEENDD